MKFVNFLKRIFVEKLWIKLVCLALAVLAAMMLNMSVFFGFSAALPRGFPGGTAGAAWQRDSAAYDKRRDSAARPVVARSVAARPQKKRVPFGVARRIY